MTSTPMASAVLTTPYLSHLSSSSPRGRKPALYSLSTCLNSNHYTSIFRSFTWIPQLCLCSFSPWIGLRQGILISQQSVRLERGRKCKGKGVFASLFGVGAPEALVIGAVALLVFGPKGLAEVARNLGQTLRAFQPTIREIQEVSREFKSTLEKEISLDEIQSPTQGSYGSNTMNTTSRPSPVPTSEDSQANVDPTNDSPSPKKPYSSEDYLKITEEQLKVSASLQQKEQIPSSLGESQFEPQTQSQEVAASTPPSQKKPKAEA